MWFKRTETEAVDGQMQFSNSEGTPVDPVPFLVVSITGLAIVFSFGPMYLLAIGLDLPAAAAGTSVALVGTTCLAYYRYVWRARPARRKVVPGPVRLKRLYYAVFVAIALLALLALPLVMR